VASEVQRIIDAIAAQLQRSVALVDLKGRELLHSRQIGPIDTVRRDRILLDQQPSDEILRWINDIQVFNDREPFRVPGNERFELLPRVGMPVRHSDLLIGLLWIVDPDDALTDTQIEVTRGYVDRIAEVMYVERMLQTSAAAEATTDVRMLLDGPAESREQAMHRLLADERFVGHRAAVLVLSSTAAPGEPADKRTRVALGTALNKIHVELAPGHSLRTLYSSHAVLVVSMTEPFVARRGLAELGERLCSAFRSQSVPPGIDPVVGVGEPVETLLELADSYVQARRALSISAKVPDFGPVACWNDLGVYRMLARFPMDELMLGALPPGLMDLLRRPEDHLQLVKTLETYLDQGGDVSATAKVLNLHRTSLYYRLDKVTKITGHDLSDGLDRLALHLGLKLWQVGSPHTAGRTASPS